MTDSTKASTRTPKAQSAFKVRLIEAEALKLESEAAVIEGKIRELRPSIASRELRVLGGLGPQVSSATLSVFSRWNRMDKIVGAQPERVVYLNASQGRFADTFAVYDVLRLSQANGGPSCTVQTTGLAATQAAIVMQAAKRRIMTPRSWLILSEIQPNAAQMNTSEGEEAVRYMKWLEDRGWKLLLERSKLDLAELKKNTEYGRQWWLNAQQALDYGLIDEIGTVMPGHEDYQGDPALAPSVDDSWQTRLEKAKLRALLAQGELAQMTDTSNKVSPEEAGKHYLFGAINTESCTEAQSSLTLFAQRKLPDVEMIINSPGGSCFDGNGLMDVIDQTMADRQFTTTIFGECASMAGFISQTGKKRVMAKNAAFLIHRVSTMFGQSSSHMAENTRNMRRLEDLLFPYMASRTNGKLSLDELQERCKANDWWLTADEALEKGLVDEVI